MDSKKPMGRWHDGTSPAFCLLAQEAVGARMPGSPSQLDLSATEAEQGPDYTPWFPRRPPSACTCNPGRGSWRRAPP